LVIDVCATNYLSLPSVPTDLYTPRIVGVSAAKTDSPGYYIVSPEKHTCAR
jgi:hypothetical protein